MIRLVDGFDLAQPIGARFKYSGYSASLDQSVMEPGRSSGQSLDIQNTGFGYAEYLAIFDAQPIWGFHCDFLIAGTLVTTGVSEVIWRWATATQTLLQLRFHDSGLVSLEAGDGTVLDSTMVPISTNTWYTVEAKVRFDGGPLEIRMGSTQSAVTPTVMYVANPGTLGAGYPDRVGFGRAGFPPGHWRDNYVVWDGSGAENNDWLGPCEVTTLKVVSDAQGDWTPSAGTLKYPMVDDGPATPDSSPDGDETFIAPGTVQLFNVESSPCFGLILGVALNVCARPLVGDQPIALLAQLVSTLHTIASVDTTPGHTYRFSDGSLVPYVQGYLTYQGIMQTNPDNGDTWVDSVLSTGEFGVGAAANVHVTAVYVEKITSLIPQHYDCGGGDYSY